MGQLSGGQQKRVALANVLITDDKLDRMVNIWNQYQCMITFCMSRSASFFESGIGRGMGFRDSNQDLVGFVHQIPTRARQRIIDIASTQFPDGFGRLRYSFGGDRPSQTARLTMSPDRIHGRRLEFQYFKSGIPRLTPQRLAPLFHSLPPILYIKYRNPISGYSKAPWGLSVLSRVTGIFTGTTISPGVHAELFQVDGLVADVHSSADIVECDFLVIDFPEIGLQFKIQVLGDDEQLYFGGDRIAFRSQRIRRERY